MYIEKLYYLVTVYNGNIRFNVSLMLSPKSGLIKLIFRRCVEIFSKPVLKAKIEPQRVVLKIFKTQPRVFGKIALFSKRCGVNMFENPGCGLYLGVYVISKSGFEVSTKTLQ